MVSNLQYNQSVISLSMGDYYCGVRKFWLSSVWCLWTETSFLSPKWCTNDAAKLRKIASPIELLMFFGDHLQLYEGLTLVLWQTVQGNQK